MKFLVGYHLVDVLYFLQQIGFFYIRLYSWHDHSSVIIKQLIMPYKLMDWISMRTTRDSFSYFCPKWGIHYWLRSLPQRMGFKLLKSPCFSNLLCFQYSLRPILSLLYLLFPTSISYTELFQWTIICFLACFIGLFILACLMRMLHSFVSFEHRFSFSCFIWICWILVLSV